MKEIITTTTRTTCTPYIHADAIFEKIKATKGK